MNLSMFIKLTVKVVFIHLFFSSLVSAEEWNYSVQGDDWKNLSGNEICGSGKEQSPINIQTTGHKIISVSANSFLNTTSPSIVFDVKNNGHTIMFSPNSKEESNNTLTIKDNHYKLLQFHFHSHSEHGFKTKNGKTEYSPAEVHFVFKSEQNNLAVIGLLLNVAKSQNRKGFIDTLFDRIPINANEDLNTHSLNSLTSLNFYLSKYVLNLPITQFYSYKGSLTTPGCNENVAWYVRKNKEYISSDTFTKIKSYHGGNFRHAQFLNNRTVNLIKVIK